MVFPTTQSCFSTARKRDTTTYMISLSKVIVTGGWDRSLRVYDEVPREGDPPLLRQVEGAHLSDINVVAVSQRLSLIASGSAGGTCKLWDFQLLCCEGTCSIGNEVLCLCFLEPYPLVAVGDAGGYVSIIPVRPWLEAAGGAGGGGRRCHAMLRFANDQQAEGTIEGPAAVTCLTHTVRPALAGGERAAAAAAAARVGGGGAEAGGMEKSILIYTGDDTGTVRAWEVGVLALLASSAPALGCHAVREEDLPRSRSNYDPRRRFYRQVCSTRRGGDRGGVLDASYVFMSGSEWMLKTCSTVGRLCFALHGFENS